MFFRKIEYRFNYKSNISNVKKHNGHELLANFEKKKNF